MRPQSRNPSLITTSDVPTVGSAGYLTLNHHGEARHDGPFRGHDRHDFGHIGHRPHSRCHVGFGFYWSRRSCPSYYAPYYAYPYVYGPPVYTYGYGVSAPVVYNQTTVVTPATEAGTVVYDNGSYGSVSAPTTNGTQAPSGVGPIEEQPEAFAKPTAEQLYQMMFEGTRAFEAGDYETAARLFMRVASQDPDNVDATLAYAVARFATGDYSIAAIGIRRGVRAYPDVVNAPFNIRDRYANPADMDPHLTALEGFVAEHPDNTDALLVLGFVQHFTRQREAAAKTLQHLTEVSVSDRELAQAFLNAKPLAEIDAELEAQQQAIEQQMQQQQQPLPQSTPATSGQ